MSPGSIWLKKMSCLAGSSSIWENFVNGSVAVVIVPAASAGVAAADRPTAATLPTATAALPAAPASVRLTFIGLLFEREIPVLPWPEQNVERVAAVPPVGPAAGAQAD